MPLLGGGLTEAVLCLVLKVSFKWGKEKIHKGIYNHSLHHRNEEWLRGSMGEELYFTTILTGRYRSLLAKLLVL